MIPQEDLDLTIWRVASHCRNFFNESNYRLDLGQITVPNAFLALCRQINAFINSPAGQPSPYASETVVGLHSWTKASSKDGTPVSWENVFEKQLNPWRKMFVRDYDGDGRLLRGFLPTDV